MEDRHLDRKEETYLDRMEETYMHWMEETCLDRMEERHLDRKGHPWIGWKRHTCIGWKRHARYNHHPALFQCQDQIAQLLSIFACIFTTLLHVSANLWDVVRGIHHFGEL
jgi:hypothetical protein